MNKQFQNKISYLQDNLATLRKLAGWSAEDLGNILGVTRQTIVNLETKQTNMTKIQYIAIATTLLYRAKSSKNKILYQMILVLSNEEKQEKIQKLTKAIDTAYDSAGRRVGSSVASKVAIKKIESTSNWTSILAALAVGCGIAGVFSVLDIDEK